MVDGMVLGGMILGRLILTGPAEPDVSAADRCRTERVIILRAAVARVAARDGVAVTDHKRLEQYEERVTTAVGVRVERREVRTRITTERVEGVVREAAAVKPTGPGPRPVVGPGG